MPERPPDHDNAAASLKRTRMDDGGEVVHGALAQQALDAVGARAMTLDHTIVVGEGFDARRPEDQALYAHEQVHMRGSGGADPHHDDHDAEEQAAREVERMVLHRAEQDATAAPSLEPDEASSTLTDADPHKDDPMGAYRAMRAQGMTHDAIVQTLARDVVQALLAQQDADAVRGRQR